MMLRRILCLAGPVVAVGVTGCTDDPAACPDEAGIACRWAGLTDRDGFDGDGKPIAESRMYWSMDVEFSPDGTPWVIDWNNHRIRRVTAEGTFETVVGDDIPGDGPPDGGDLMGESPGDTVRLNHPTDMAVLDDGTLLFAAWHNHKIREVDPVTGMVHVSCGRGPGFGGDGMPQGAATRFNQPSHMQRGPDGSIFLVDQRNQRIRRIGPDGVLSTIAGTGMPGFSGDGGDPLMAQLAFEAGGNPEPSGGVAVGSDGRVYVSDSLNHRIRVIDLDANTIDTLAGTGSAGFSGDGGAATDAQLNTPRDLEIGPDGRLYFADTENNRIRAIDLSSGTIETVAGSGRMGNAEPDGLGALEIEMERPFGVAFDAEGALYVSDTYNSRVIRIPLAQ